MVLSEFGRIVEEEWLRSIEMRSELEADVFVVMPNHLHGIILIRQQSDVGASGSSPFKAERPGPSKKSIGAFVGGFKAAVTKRINAARATPAHPVWQRNYHDQIIRAETQLEQTRTYLNNNPRAWPQDEENPALSTCGIRV